jgi:hypothetical protein
MLDTVQKVGILALIIGVITALLGFGTSFLLKTVSTDYTDPLEALAPTLSLSELNDDLVTTDLGFFDAFNYYAQVLYDSPMAAVVDAAKKDKSKIDGLLPNEFRSEERSKIPEWSNARFPTMIVVTLQASIAALVVSSGAMKRGMKLNDLRAVQMLAIGALTGLVTVVIGQLWALLTNRLFMDYTDRRYTLYPFIDELGFFQALWYYPRVMYRTPFADVVREQKAMRDLVCKRDKTGAIGVSAAEKQKKCDEKNVTWTDATLPVSIIVLVQTTLAVVSSLAIVKLVPALVRA